MHLARLIRVISQSMADFLDAVADTFVEVDKSVLAPELLLNLFPSNNLSGPAGRKNQDLERLRLELCEPVIFALLAGIEIREETVEVMRTAEQKAVLI